MIEWARVSVFTNVIAPQPELPVAELMHSAGDVKTGS